MGRPVLRRKGGGSGGSRCWGCGCGCGCVCGGGGGLLLVLVLLSIQVVEEDLWGELKGQGLCPGMGGCKGGVAVLWRGGYGRKGPVQQRVLQRG